MATRPVRPLHPHLIDQLSDLQDRGIEFRSLQENIDTTSPGGRPPLLAGDKLATARKLYDQQDMTVAQIGDILGVSRTTIYRALRRDPDFTPTQHRQASKQ